MKKNKLQKGIDEIKNIVMTDAEKKSILENILKSPENIQKPIKSPWFNFSFMAMLHKKQLVYYIILPLIIILSSGGVVFASQKSLPNSILYPLKVNIVEPIRGVLTFSYKNKAKYEINLATERLVEAETLASQGKLDKINEKKLNNLLEKHTVALDKALSMVKEKEPKEQLYKIKKQNDEKIEKIREKFKKEGKNEDY